MCPPTCTLAKPADRQALHDDARSGVQTRDPVQTLHSIAAAALVGGGQGLDLIKELLEALERVAGLEQHDAGWPLRLASRAEILGAI